MFASANVAITLPFFLACSLAMTAAMQAHGSPTKPARPCAGSGELRLPQ
jgi:hypothetical protein